MTCVSYKDYLSDYLNTTYMSLISSNKIKKYIKNC